MRQKELNRLEIINKVIDKGLTQSHAAKHLGLSCRQVCRLIDAYKKDSAKESRSAQQSTPSGVL